MAVVRPSVSVASGLYLVNAVAAAVDWAKEVNARSPN